MFWTQVHDTLDKVRTFSEQVRSGKLRGATGKLLTNIVAVGIGGSYLGPEFVHEVRQKSFLLPFYLFFLLLFFSFPLYLHSYCQYTTGSFAGTYCCASTQRCVSCFFLRIFCFFFFFSGLAIFLFLFCFCFLCCWKVCDDSITICSGPTCTFKFFVFLRHVYVCLGVRARAYSDLSRLYRMHSGVIAIYVRLLAANQCGGVRYAAALHPI